MHAWRSGVVVLSLCGVSISSGAERSIPDLAIILDEWTIVPTTLGPAVESFVAFRDLDEAVGANVTTVWFVRSGDDAWSALAWPESNNLAAVAHIKVALALEDETDACWPIDGAAEGIDPSLATPPESFGLGLFQSDPLLEVVESLPEPGTFLADLVADGWSAAHIRIQTETAGCEQHRLLSSLAAIIEADLATDAGGSLVDATPMPPEHCERWYSMVWPLDSSGVFVVPDLSEYLFAAGSIDPSDAWQSPEPGTEVTGEQVLVISSGGQGLDGPEVFNEAVVTLRDFSPPTIDVDVQTDGPLLETPAGIPYVVAPATVVITATVTDGVDNDPDVIAADNGIPYFLGAPIASVGIHVLTIQAADDAGNTRSEVMVFEIRERPFYGATAAIESWQCDWETDHVARVEATVLLAADEFDEWGIHLASMQLFLLDEQGAMLSPGILISDVTECDAEPGEPIQYCYGPDLGAEYQHGYWRLSFAEAYAGGELLACPRHLMVAGRSSSDRAAAPFDFTAVAEASAVLDAIGLLTQNGLVDESVDPRPNPGIDPPVTCEWKYELVNMRPDDCEEIDEEASDCGWLFNFRQFSRTLLEHRVGKPDGHGWAEDEGCPGAAASTCSVIAGGTLRMWLEPRPTDTECQLTVRAYPSFKARVRVNTPALAVAGGHIQVTAPGLTATASGAIAVGDNPPTNVQIGPDWVIPVYIGSKTASSRPFTSGAPQEVTIDACEVSVQIGSAGFIDVSADAWNFPLGSIYAFASGTRSDATPNITVTGAVIAGPCDGMTRTESYR